MKKMLSCLCDWLIKNKIISEKDKEVYEYCFTVLILNLIYFSICLAIMRNYHFYLQPTIFLITFLLLRSYTGGWHLSSAGGCLIGSSILFFAVTNLMIQLKIPEQVKVLFCIFSIVLIYMTLYFNGIQDHVNRKIDQKQQFRAKKQAYRILLGLSGIMLIMGILNQFDLMFSIALACFMVTLLLLLAKVQKIKRKEGVNHAK